jgi:hypothetical protein
MRPLGLTSMAVLFVLLGTVPPAYAQQDKPAPDGKPLQQEPEAKPDKQQPQAKGRQAKDQQGKQPQQQAQPEKGQQPAAKGQQPRQQQQPATPQKRQQPTKGQQQQANRPPLQRKPVEQSQQRGVWLQHRAHNWQSEHRTWQQRGGYHGYRIPEDRFHDNFGRDHWFRIYRFPLVMVGRYPRFQYGGFWFRLVDPWPESWPDAWYETDDVYIDYYRDGYYLYNRNHPGVSIAVNVYVG